MFVTVPVATLAQSGTDYLNVFKITDSSIIFDVNSEGQPFRVNWGMDTAWDSEANVRRGVNHIGKENFSTGRLSFQPTYKVTTNADGSLQLNAAQIRALQSRINHLKLTGVTEANINCDNAASMDVLSDGTKGIENYGRNCEEWYKLIKASVQYCQSHGIKIISISPYNEPDYEENKYWFKSDFLKIFKLIREDSYFEGIRLCGGNTLNCDRAWDWYESLRSYLDEGNTHQLAGSFDTYANFFTKVRADGKMATNDELHNVGEAIVGVNYGMQTGIWWGFDSHARGQFCRDSQEGVRIGYGEDRTHWTSGAVYRNEKTGEIHGFLGSSERQANNSSFSFVSTAKDVYFNGYGPARQWVYDIPGGTGYQQGQTNAELCFDITSGDDVQPDTINGLYQLMCRSGRRVLSVTNTSASSGTQICVKTATANAYDDWLIEPVSTRVGGDFGYFTIKNALTKYPIDAWNWGLSSGSELRVFNGALGDNEQWYLKYAGAGYYYIINRYSNLYLTASGSTNGALVNQSSLGTTDSRRSLQQWRIIPTDAVCEVVAPARPSGLKAEARSASVRLSWTANSEDDLVGYMILRGDSATGEWNTIARKVKSTTFTDNNCRQSTTYHYAIKAIDYSDNLSYCSDTLTVCTNGERTLIGRWDFENSLKDFSVNYFDAKLWGTEKYGQLASMKKIGEGALSLDEKSFLQLPYKVADVKELTIAFWIRWMSGSGGSEQRLFDFGNSSTQCMYLTPSSGSKMKLVMRNAEEEQVLEAPKLSASIWKHVTVTFGKESVRIYINGEQVAETTVMTLRPSDVHPILNYIGRSQDGKVPGLKCYFDDLRIYNFELSASAVFALAENLTEDVNFDGVVDTQDALKIYEFMQQSTISEAGVVEDVNADGTVDTQDILKIFEYMSTH